MIPAAACATLAALVIPCIYSYCIYKKHQKEGIVYVSAPGSKGEKLAVTIILAAAAFIFVVTAFTGNIEVRCGDTSFKIEATYWTDIEIEYSEIDSLVCRDDFDKGVRTYGFGSPRLSIGSFQNDEFGSYTLYAYTDAEEYIVLEISKKILVIGMKDTDETQEIYQSILAKMDR